MDYIEAFKNLKTNNKYSRKSPHKAILLLSVIEMYETNVLSENMILYDDMLKSTFQKVWERTLKDETLFHPELYLPFWYMQNEDFWHIVPNRGREDILTLLRDSHVKPSEAKLKDCVRYAELDEDLYFLMTLPSGRSSLKRVLLETYTTLSERQIDRMAQSADNAIDYSASALSDYEKILANQKDKMNIVSVETDNELVRQFQTLSEDLQIVMNLQYFSFLKSHRNEREMFKEICPTVYDLLDKINHPIHKGDITPSFAFIYDNFLSDLKIALMSEEGSMELIDKIGVAIDLLRGIKPVDESNESLNNIETSNSTTNDPIQEEPQKDDTESSVGEMEVEHVFLDSRGEVIDKAVSNSVDLSEKDFATDNRKGKPWTKEEEDMITRHFNQGRDISTIAFIIGRTEVAIKSRLAKLGLIEYTYGQEEQMPIADLSDKRKTKERDFIIENTDFRCSLLDRLGDRVFSAEGKLKYLGGKLYRLNLKSECFSLKSMQFDGEVWVRGDKKIVAYPRTELYRILDDAIDYSVDVEDIVDSPVFENCKLKVRGVWYNYKGELISEGRVTRANTGVKKEQGNDLLSIRKHPLYAVRRQAVIRAMGFFRLPARIKDIARTISRSAWRDTIKEEDVEDIIKTLPEIESIEGKYIMRKKQ